MCLRDPGFGEASEKANGDWSSSSDKWYAKDQGDTIMEQARGGDTPNLVAEGDEISVHDSKFQVPPPKQKSPIISNISKKLKTLKKHICFIFVSPKGSFDIDAGVGY